MSLDSSTQCAGDNGRQEKTKTPDQYQHLAGLFSGDGRGVNRSSRPAIVHFVENAPVTGQDEPGNHQRNSFSEFVSTHRLHVFLASSNAGYRREAYGYQVLHALPLCCYKEEH